MLVEMVGPELGLPEQELAKLALVAGNDKYHAEMIQKMGGGWRAKTPGRCSIWPWTAMQPRPCGRSTGSWPTTRPRSGYLAQISASLRRLAAATRLILQGEAAGRRIGVGPPCNRRRQTLRAKRSRVNSAVSADSAAANSIAGFWRPISI